MNVRKWIEFVLGSEPESSATQLQVVSRYFIDPELLLESLPDVSLGDPADAIVGALVDNPVESRNVLVDPFDESGKVSIEIKETINCNSDTTDLELEADSFSPAEMLFEKSFYRMRQYGIYKFGCLIDYETTSGDGKRGLEDIVSDIRAIPTVTIVSVVLANEKVSSGRYVAGLQIKFIPSFPGSLSQPEDAKAYILRMIKKIKNVRGISRVTLKTDRIE